VETYLVPCWSDGRLCLTVAYTTIDLHHTRICADMATVESLGVAYTPHPHSESVPG
jgi:hypothetical protein